MSTVCGEYVHTHIHVHCVWWVCTHTHTSTVCGESVHTHTCPLCVVSVYTHTHTFCHEELRSIAISKSNFCKFEQWTSAGNEWTVYKCIPAILIERQSCLFSLHTITLSLCANIYKLIARQYNALINVMPHHLLYGVQWGKVGIWLIISILQKVGDGEDYWGFACSTSMPFPKTIAVIKMHDLRGNQMPDYSGTSYNRLSK